MDGDGHTGRKSKASFSEGENGGRSAHRIESVSLSDEMGSARNRKGQAVPGWYFCACGTAARCGLVFYCSLKHTLT